MSAIAPATDARAGGYRELLLLALPLVLSSSFVTLQITIDRILLSRLSVDASAAAMPGIMLFWTPMALLLNTAAYVNVFVAQYTGAKRPQRVGPVVWQTVYFAVVAGLAFLGLIPLAPQLVALGAHSPVVQALEIEYFQALCWCALPSTLTAAFNGFFSGRGDSWTVLLVNAVGTGVNTVLAYLWIFGVGGFPHWGIAGAGWAMVVGSWASALLAAGLFLRSRYEAEFHTRSGWAFDLDLFTRLLRFGLPNGVQWCIDGLAFTAFILLVGRYGQAELAATNITFAINLLAVLPVMGLGQAVEIIVGQRQGERRPDLSARSTYRGLALAWVYMMVVAGAYFGVPDLFVTLFQNETDPEQWHAVAEWVPILLRFVALYSLFDSFGILLSFALRGAGDVRFVTVASIVLAWPFMVLPTYWSIQAGHGLLWGWAFASFYVLSMAVLFLGRFWQGKWRSMRVIEDLPSEPDTAPVEPGPTL
jgi:MATE family multidrug resistance protein